jgi:hypothetical protein
LITIEEMRETIKRCRNQEQLMRCFDWAVIAVKAWDRYYQELVGCWFYSRACQIAREENNDAGPSCD